MAKTRRHKTNRSPRKVFGRNVEPVVLENGERKRSANAGSKIVRVGTVLTGKNMGKVYPYAGAKRRGDPYKIMARAFDAKTVVVAGAPRDDT